MNETIETVSWQVLLGRSVDEVEQNRQEYERLIKEVFDRVLVGYSITKVEITPGSVSYIKFHLTPWNDVVKTCSVEIELGTISPDIQSVIISDVNDIQSKVEEVFLGLPIEAVDWAGILVKTMLKDYFDNKLPDFKPNFDITAGENTLIKISLVPIGSVVNDIDVIIESSDFPNLLLKNIQSDVEKELWIMRGLPISLIDNNKEYFLDLVNQKVQNHHLTKFYGLEITPKIISGSITKIELNVVSRRYRIFVEGYMDIGRDNDDDSFSAKLHFGKMFGSGNNNEVFVEMLFWPNNFKTHFEPGLGRKFGKTSLIDYRYNISKNSSKARIYQDIGSKFTLRLERDFRIKENEFGIRYKIHELLSVEYIFTDGENWLRVIGKL